MYFTKIRGLTVPLPHSHCKYTSIFGKNKIFWEKIVLISSFCTSLRIAKCSHRSTMLRFCNLALHKNNLIISDFFAWVEF